MTRGWLTLSTHTLFFVSPCDAAADGESTLAGGPCDARACAPSRRTLLLNLVSLERVELARFGGVLDSGLAFVAHDECRLCFFNFLDRERVRDAVEAQQRELACWSIG
ncbi:hypothetical protein T492DRAFT_958422 [Pavlovales sp. CCMP2436]|nr:hypothetical protein T492DRAFT_958422 [Pavlovales sp. CCMP2436]